MAKFIISTDNCADYYKSFWKSNGIYCIPLKRILGDKEFAEIYDSDKEFKDFYEDLKKGARPTTSQINPDEFVAHFNKILKEQKEGDIIHISLSSALSGSHNSAVLAAQELNPTLKGRKIYAFDSLSVSGGMMMHIDTLLKLRGNTPADKAYAIIEKMRDNQHLFFIVDDLFHLKRGGRISATKAFIGSILGIKPVMILNKYGKLCVIDRVKGSKKTLEYFFDKFQKYGPKPDHDFANETIFLVRSTESETYNKLKEAVKVKYPKALISETLLGPIIGTHVGSGAVAIIFCGKPRLE